jgi:uracil-DNA glycosylase family 4
MQSLMFSEEEMYASPAHDYTADCNKCGLFRGCRSPRMPVFGEGRKRILIVGEAPGENEDRIGRPFVGNSGQYLSKVLSDLDINMDGDCWRVNACRCHPPGNDTPTKTQIKMCRKRLFEDIERLKPEKIITLGQIGLEGVLGHLINITALSKWVGWGIPDQHLQTYVFPNYHPAYVLRNSDNKAVDVYFRSIMRKALNSSGTFYSSNYGSDVFTIRDEEEAIKILKEFSSNRDVVAFDYETSGIKPYREGHKIIAMSISDGLFSYSFPMFDSDRFRKVVVRFLESDVKKVAHNAKFEDTWSKVILGADVKNWEFDTMLASHILDFRGGITGLKFQTYVNFGVWGYEDSVSQYMKPAKDEDSYGDNAFNKLFQCPIEDLLFYCGKDSLYTFKLYEKQKNEIEKRFGDAFDLFMRGSISLAEIERNGIRADREYYERICKEGKEEIEEIIKSVQSIDGVPEDFSIRSNKQVGELLYDTIGLECKKETKGGGQSVDDDALSKLNHPIADAILRFRKKDKLVGTYLSGFVKEISDDNKLHCFFNLNMVRTYRSSSNSINFQNIPKRDEEAKKLTRSGLFAKEGHFLSEKDFKSIEVCISACYHKDDKMIEYILDPSTDMHRDMASEIFMKGHDEVTKKERYQAKNGFVFPQFYGSVAEACARNIWDEMDEESKLHLRRNRIRTIGSFVQHVQMIEDDFWFNRFKKYGQWRLDNWEMFQKRGVLKYKTGFRCAGILGMKEVNNYPIQGSAFHCLLNVLNQYNGFLKGKESFIMGQIHDSIIDSTDPAEEEKILKAVSSFLTQLRQEWKWIIVPLVIEYEKTGIDEPWYELKEVGKIYSDDFNT